jgi:hypothetical protein
MHCIFAGRVAVLLVSASLSTFASATAQRTFVRSDGVDNPSCSLVAPCRGFTAAVTATSAGGEVIVLDSAGYGSVIISKSMSIIAPAGIYAGISVLTGNIGIIVGGSGVVVVLRGLTINGLGGSDGIFMSTDGNVHVENCVISRMTNAGISQDAGTLEVKDTIVRNGDNIGIYVISPGRANLDRVRLEGNPYGLAAEAGGHVSMQDSLVTGSTGIAVLASSPTSTGTNVTISRSMISSSNYGIYVDGNNGDNLAQILVSDSTISENTVGIHVTSRGGLTGYNSPGSLFAAHNSVTANHVGLELVEGGFATIDANQLIGNYFDVTVDDASMVATRGNNAYFIFDHGPKVTLSPL